MIIFDTNVISELMRSTPDDSVTTWVSAHPVSDLYTTTITQAEILYGIMLLAPGKRRASFEAAAESMFAEEFGGRILPFESDAARHYGRIAAVRTRAGQPISNFDAQIAAIACSTGGTILTRNTKDFEGCGVKIINPWASKV